MVDASSKTVEVVATTTAENTEQVVVQRIYAQAEVIAERTVGEHGLDYSAIMNILHVHFFFCSVLKIRTFYDLC